MKVEIYIYQNPDYCNYCQLVLDWFIENDIYYKEIKVNYFKRKLTFLDIKKKYNIKVNTLPLIFINDEYFGGYADLILKKNIIIKKLKEGSNGNKNILKNGLYLL